MFLKFLFALLSALPVFVQAQESIPLRFIGVQVFNFTLFVFLLFYFIKKPLKNYLKNNKESFLKDLRQASLQVDQNLKICQKWQKDIKDLEDKQKNQNERIKQALQIHQQSLEKSFLQKQQVLKTEIQREWKRQKYQQLKLVKQQILDSVLSQATLRLKQASLKSSHLLSIYTIKSRS